MLKSYFFPQEIRSVKIEGSGAIENGQKILLTFTTLSTYGKVRVRTEHIFINWKHGRPRIYLVQVNLWQLYPIIYCHHYHHHYRIIRNRGRCFCSFVPTKLGASMLKIILVYWTLDFIFKKLKTQCIHFEVKCSHTNTNWFWNLNGFSSIVKFDGELLQKNSSEGNLQGDPL
jgi:hypothetical protein